MHNTKRVISMMLVLCMLMSVLPIGAFAAENTDGTANGDAQTVSLTVGESKSFTDNSGDYSEMGTSGLDTSVATVSMIGSSKTVTYGVLKDSTNNGTEVALSDSEYTFTGADSAYEITIDKDGSTWYIKGSSGGHSTTKVTNTITWNDDGSVYLYDGSRYLFVYRNTLKWDKVDKTSGYETHCKFYIYGKGDDTESAIPGYKMITKDDITSGNTYLIVFYDENNNIYCVNPTTRKTDAYNQMAAIVTEEQTSTAITFTGVSAGETSVTIGTTTYNITVTTESEGGEGGTENVDPLVVKASEYTNAYKGTAVSISAKPANGTTEGQPFLTGTGGSWNFRIPGITTLNNGTIIASTDARWNRTGDGAGLDTLVSVSTDNGANWTYTYANYLGDNGNIFNELSTCIIDPAIGTDGTTAYLIADLWPAGIALNTSKYSPVVGENGFDENGNLMLRDLSKDTVVIGESGYNTMAAACEYNYYLNLKDYKIYTKNGTLCEGFAVDKYFNITYTDSTNKQYSTNLFFADSPFQPYPTDYLYMTTSTDGLNWSEPELLNLQTKDEQSLLVGPGNGTYDSESGRMIFTAYRHTGGAPGTSYECACLIWKGSDGVWHRSEDATTSAWSSEASCVVLDDGTVRIFYRDGYSVLRYTDYQWSATENNYVRDASATEVSTSAAVKSGCQLSAIMYSKQIEGKDAILVSSPSNSGSRADGRLYVFLVGENNSMELAYAYDIIPNANEGYAYSCITEMNDGNIALLYEGDYAATSGSAEIVFTTIDMDDVVSYENDARLTWVDVALDVNESVSYTDYTGNYSSADVSSLDTSVAKVSIQSKNVTTTIAESMSDGGAVAVDNCLYTFTATGAENTYYISATLADGTTVYVEPYSQTVGSGCPNVGGSADALAVQVQAGKSGNQVRLYDGTGSLHFHFEQATPYWNRCKNDPTGGCAVLLLYRPANDSETSSTEIPGYVQINRSEIVSGGQYLIAAQNNAGNTYILNPVSSTNSADHMAKISGTKTLATSEITFTGVEKGTTEVQIGSTVYSITVDNPWIKEKTVEVGGSITVEDVTGDEVAVEDSKIASATLTDGNLTITGLYPGETSVSAGGIKYVVTVEGTVVQVELKAGETYSYVAGDAGTTAPDASVATVESVTSTVAQMGGDTTFSGDYVDLSACLYTFTKNDESGKWHLSATTADGKTVYIDAHAGTGNGGYPNRIYTTEITLVNGTNGAIKIKDDGGTLHFWDNNDSKLHWDQCTGDGCTGHNLLVFRPAEDGENSDIIDGYVQVTDVADLVSGNQYLIVGHTNSGMYLAMNPSTSTSNKYAHLAKIVEANTVVITGAAAGKTSMRVGATIFEISVEKESPFVIKGANIVAGNTLDMYFYVAREDLAGLTDCYAVITREKEDGSVITKQIPYSDWEEYDSTRMRFRLDGIAAKEMTDAITVQVYNGDGAAASELWNDSVKAYAMRTMAKTTDSESITVLVDMLNYGAAAQDYFDYRTGDLANADLGEYAKCATQSVELKDQRVKGANYKGSTVQAESNLILTPYFENITTDMYAVVTYTDHYGKKHSEKIEGSDFYVRTSTMTGVDVETLVVADGDTLVTVKVYDAAGKEVASASDSINSYTCRMQNEHEVYTLMAKFCKSAYAYFH